METFWKLAFYEDERRNCEMEEFAKSLKPGEWRKMLAWFKLLREQGPQLSRPYADLLRSGIHELRVRLSGSHTRLLYFFYQRNKIVLTHAFVKTTPRVPEQEILKALGCREEILNRHLREENRDAGLRSIPW